VNPLGAATPPSPDPGTLGVMETLGDLALAAHDPRLGRVRFTPPVAAALRAALDWLLTDAQHRPVIVRVDDTALDVWLERVDARGLVAAGEVLASVAGSLGRGGYGARRTAMWIVRVPIAAARESFLMIVRGTLRLALPWPSVLHVAMARRSDLESARLNAPVVEAPGTLSAADEIPVVLIANGLKRAWLPADRLIWRLGAKRGPSSPPPAEGLTHAVDTGEEQPYWVVDPAWLLHDVPPPPLPKAEPIAVLTAADVQPIELPPALDRMHVTRIEEDPPAEGRGGAPPPSSGHETPIEVTDPVISVPGRAALVAEDSLVAAAFLTRLLEQEGLLVKSVAKAAPLFSEAARGGWAVALVDVELPDGRGAAFLRELRDAFEHPARPGASVPTLIALVRDADDIAEARRAGISLVLRKPFEAQALRALLRRAGVTMEEQG